LLALSLLIIFSCKKDDSEPFSEPEDETIASEKAKVFTESEWDNTVESVDSAYTFILKNNTKDLQVGDIIVGTVNGGYLRKVKEVNTSEDEIIVKTEFASLTEAIEKTDISYQIELEPDLNSDELWFAEGVRLKQEKSASELKTGLNIDVVIYDMDGNFNTTYDQTKIKGSFELGADFDLEIDIEKFNLEYLQFKYEFTEKYKLEGKIGVAGEKLRKELERKIAQIPCGEYVIPGAIPIVIKPYIVLKAGVKIESLASCEMGIQQEQSYTTFIKYDEGNWTTDKEINKQFISETPDFKGEIEAKIYIKPEMGFKVYKVIASYINEEVYGKAEVEYFVLSNSLDWEIAAGLISHAGVRCKIFKKSLFDFYATILEIEEVILDGQIGDFNQTPIADFTFSPQKGKVGEPVTFDASSSTDYEDALNDLQCRWDFDGDGIWDTNWSTDKTESYTYNEVSTYSVKLEIKDTHGATGTTAKNIEIEDAFAGETGTFTDSRDGNTYKWVKIGDQVWMAENLAYLPKVSPPSEYSGTEPYYYVYGYEGSNVSEAKATYNYKTYGVLYNWPAAFKACPNGWHLPTDEEWIILTNYLGGGYLAGGKMKSIAGWEIPNIGATNSSGFCGLPGGNRNGLLKFGNLGVQGTWCSSTENDWYYAWFYYLTYNSPFIYRTRYAKGNGWSVRCIKD